jgi:hypothetical protein
MKQLVRLICIAAAALLLLVLIFARLITMDRLPAVTAVVFESREPTDIDRVTAENANGGFLVAYNKDLGGYDVDDIPADLVDMDAFINLLTRSGAVSALTRLQANSGNLANYGLESAQASIAIAYADGTTFSFSIGNREPISGDYYMRVNADPSLYLFAAENAQVFLASKETYISHEVTPELAVSSPLTAVKDVTFTGTALPEPITIQSVGAGSDEVRLAAQSFGAVTHLVRGRGVHELDQTYGITVIGSLLGIKAVSVRGYSLDAQKISALGFDTPYIEAGFDLKNGTDDVTHYLLSVVKADDGTYLARVSGKDAVYVIEKPAFADIQYSKLILRWFLSPLLLDISGLTVDTGTQKLDIAYTRGSNQDQSATANGQAVDISLFQSFYRLVTSASSDGDYLPGAVVSGNPVMTITYHYKDGVKADDVISFYPGSARRLLAQVNGVTEFDIRESFITRVVEACSALMSGKPIEESW